MADPVKIAFERKILTLPIADLLPTKALPAGVRETVKYRRIAASVAEVGLIEPLSIARQKDGSYLLLDGHMRLDALRFLGAPEVACVVADDDESFTYNKRVNRLATIQEHYMIVRALDRGVSEEKLARALNVDVKVIRQRRHLLAGITADVAELLKDKPVGHHAFQKLRKMKPIRQLEAAELMVSANTTGGTIATPFSGTAYSTLTSTDQNLISNGTYGANQLFSVQYQATPGFTYPAGTYTTNVIYTATQQ